MEFFALGVLCTIIGSKLFKSINVEPKRVKVPVYTLEDDVRTIRTIKELEYWKDFRNKNDYTHGK